MDARWRKNGGKIEAKWMQNGDNGGKIEAKKVWLEGLMVVVTQITI